MNLKQRLIWGIVLIGTIFFWYIRSPQTISQHIIQYIILFNGIVFFIIWGGISYRIYRKSHNINLILSSFAEHFTPPLKYSYTPVSVIKSSLYDTSKSYYLTKPPVTKGGKTHFTIFFYGQFLDFSTLLKKTHDVIDLASVIVYYLEYHHLSYEFLYEHAKTITIS